MVGRHDIRSTCIPGGKIDNVSKAVEDSGNSDSIVISVGTNEIGKSGYVSITEKYYNLFEKVKAKKAKVVVVGILPRLKESAQWSSRAIAINNWLKQQCVVYDFEFLDLWEVMYENRYYYSRDGIHMNFNGRAFLTRVIINKLKGIGINFLGFR